MISYLVVNNGLLIRVQTSISVNVLDQSDELLLWLLSNRWVQPDVHLATECQVFNVGPIGTTLVQCVQTKLPDATCFGLNSVAKRTRTSQNSIYIQTNSNFQFCHKDIE